MSVADKITRLKTARDNIRTALAGYDIDASDHGYEDFADDIEGIKIFDPDDYAVNIIETTGDPIEPDSSEIRTFSNIQTDGTTSSVVNTGIYLFGDDLRFGFEIEADFDNMTDSGTGDYRRIFSCEANSSPYPGLNLTRKKGDNDAATLTLNNTNTVEIEFQLLSEHNTVSVKYDAESGEVVLVANGTTVRDTVTPLPEVAAYFTLGGQMYVDGTISTNRCAAVKINSVTVKPLKYQVVYSRDYKYIGKSVSKLASGIFTGNNEIVEVQLPTSITELGTSSFNECANLRSINLQNITRLEQDSLRGCKSIRILYMPNLTDLHHYACSPGTGTTFALEEIHFPKMTGITGLGFREYSFFAKCPNLRLIDVSGATSIGNGSFENFNVGTNVINVILSENLKTLGQYIFYNSNSRMNVNGGIVYLPNLESVGRDCFSNTLIEKVISLGKITVIGYSAFANCKKLKFIRVPSTVTSIQGGNAFSNNNTNVTIVMEPITPPSLNSTIYSNYIIYVPDESVDAYKEATGWSSAASKIHPMSEYTGTD